MSRKIGAPTRLYTVYNNRTDELIILDGTVRQCAEAMGLSEKSFLSTATRSKNGKGKWWIEPTDKATMKKIREENGNEIHNRKRQK